MMKDRKEPEQSDKISEFIQKNRKGIFIFGGTIIGLGVLLIVFLFASDLLNKKALEKSEELAVRFEALRWNLEDENYANEVNELFSDLENFAKKNRGLAASRVYSFIARIHSSKGEWALCEQAWLKAAQSGNKTYMAPIALFNAAAALEEQGRVEEAIEYLEKSINHPFEFPAAPRAQFNIGRLYQQMGNRQAALEAYRAVLIDWQNIPVWPHLARTAIIRLEIEAE